MSQASSPSSRPRPGSTLSAYREKRDFVVTSEPDGMTTSAPAGHRFVVQRHRAKQLHYDLRLEIGGVLVSWAVPKGPTLDPEMRRLAVHVEDHPLDYFDFEGVIPEGEYGGGDVIVWDWGTWHSVDDADFGTAVDEGELHFELDGKKLHGRFALIRRGRRSQQEQWLLIHKHDAAAVVGWDPEKHPRSVKTSRTNDEVVASTLPETSTPPGQSPRSWVGATSDEVDELDSLGDRGGEWSIGGRTVHLTNLDKELFVGAPSKRNGTRHPHTKRDVIRYYVTMAPTILPYLADRPVNLRRYPNGVGQPGFWQRAVPASAPEWLTRWRVPDTTTSKTQHYVVLDRVAALAWAANSAAVEMHPWTSTAVSPEEPTWALIDVDPGPASTFDQVVLLARLHKTALTRLGLRACPKVTGQRGVQIWIPIAHGYTFDETRRWVEQLSRLIGDAVPDLVSWEWAVAKREGKIRLDFTQNAMNKTLVAPYSIRPQNEAPVSVPIEWDELEDPELRPNRWTLNTVPRRVRSSGDPLNALIGLQQRLPTL